MDVAETKSLKEHRSVRLLVSVRNVEEARAAFDGGADLIDLKEPRNGSLGAVSVSVAQDVCHWFRGLRDAKGVRLSLAMDELLYQRTFPNELLSEFAFAKVGLAGCGEAGDCDALWNAWSAGLPANIQPVAVIYADWKSAKSPPPAKVLQIATVATQTRNGGGVLVDTFKKTSNLFHCVESRILKKWIVTAQSTGGWAAIAGSLDSQTVAQAMFMNPDIIAVRGAVCDGKRTDAVCQSLVAALRARIDSLAGMTDSDAVDV